jgi:hypothetical protein
MILDKKDIKTFSLKEKLSSDFTVHKTVKMYAPAGVFFEMIKNDKGDFLYFTIFNINEKGEIENKKNFEAPKADEFFEAVKYFEKLISERIPETEPEDPQTTGTFTYFTNGFNKDKSFLSIDGNQLVIPDIEVKKILEYKGANDYSLLDFFKSESFRFNIIFLAEISKKKTEEAIKEF